MRSGRPHAIEASQFGLPNGTMSWIAWLRICILLGVAGLAQAAAAQSPFTGEFMPYDAFDRLETSPIRMGSSVLNVGFAPGALDLPQHSFMSWIERSAKSVAVYYGRFPVDSARILLVPVPGNDLGNAQTWGYYGAAIRFMVGREATEANLSRDWSAVHEMVHLATPDLDKSHLWLEEGIAVYVEPIARLQAGELTAEKVWGDLVRDMPQGQPKTGDLGLDHTHTWGRTYWGGAIFCLLADIEIRKRTENRAGLQQALRAILAEGGTQENEWPIERLIRVGDKATGTSVLAELYEKTRAAPYTADLDSLWRELGISVDNGRLTFDDRAPLASVRRAIGAVPSETERL